MTWVAFICGGLALFFGGAAAGMSYARRQFARAREEMKATRLGTLNVWGELEAPVRRRLFAAARKEMTGGRFQ